MRFFKSLFSMQAVMFLLIILAVVCACATFIEARYGAEAARALVYEALWFEVLFLLVAIQLWVRLLRKESWKRGKSASLLIHIALLLILFGCGLTRHLGFQALMPIREGETNNRMLTERSYLSIQATHDTVRIQKDRPLLFSPFSKPKWSETFITGDDTLMVSAAGWIDGAEKRIEPGSSGNPVLAIMAELDGERRMLVLESGDSEQYGGVTFGFETDLTDGPYVMFRMKNDGLIFTSSPQAKIETAPDQWTAASSRTPLVRNRIASVGSVRFVLRDWTPHGSILAVPSNSEDIKNASSALALDVFNDGGSRRVWLFNVPGESANSKRITAGRFQVVLAFGRKSVALPFSLRLDDFTVERYPGSMKPSGFTSQVMVLDAQQGRRMPYRISMNHILKYRGYRFYQSDFDPDERGSVLSVTRDPGMIPVYAGFALLGLGLIWNLLQRSGRFKTLGRMLKHSGVLLFAAVLWQSSVQASEPKDSKAAWVQSIDQSEAKHFSNLLIQDGGRIKPVGTLVRELMHSEPGLNDLAPFGADRVALALFVRPEWFETGASGDQPLKRFRLFPKPKDPYQAWFAPQEVSSRFPKALADSILIMTNRYRTAILNADRESSAHALSAISSFQRKQGGDLIPHLNQLKAERFYNDLDPFTHLWPFLAVLGPILIVTMAVQWLKPRFRIGIWMKMITVLIAVGFVFFTAGMALRWMASGHAPWSNKYESVLYISWAVLAAGMFSLKHSRIGLGLASTVSGTFLWAVNRFMDPAITTLPPVLKSIWLVIHVSIITASYGFFILSALIAVTSLCSLMVKSTSSRVRFSIRRRTLTVEKSLIVGLTLLMLGNGLGAIWANESWGRYWGWDPKETWTLVTLLCYAITLHLRFIPRFDTPFWLNAGALVSFGSVFMTYFVIIGMHSYAAGSSAGFPVWIYGIAGLGVLLIGCAAVNGRAISNKSLT